MQQIALHKPPRAPRPTATGLATALALAVGCNALLAPPAAQAQVTPGDVAGAVGNVYSILKGLDKKLRGESKRQVWCVAKIDGPHGQSGHDVAYNDDHDVYDSIFESELDAATRAEAENHGRFYHFATGEMHYKDFGSNNGWRPNASFGFYNNQAWILSAYAGPDGNPTPGQDNTTSADAVCLFHASGMDITSWKPQKRSSSVSSPKAKRLANYSVAANLVVPFQRLTEVPDTGAEPVRAESQAGLYFSPGRFIFKRLAGGQVQVSPIGGEQMVELFNNTVTVGDQPAPIPKPFGGLVGTASGLVADMVDQLDGSLNTALLPAAQRLTLTGAALYLGSGSYPRYFADGSEKSQFDLLRDYFNDLNAVRIAAPAQAQARYVPNVTCRELVTGDQPVDCPNISDDLRQSIVPAQMDNSAEGLPVEDLIGIVVAVSGSLADAVNLAANTPGSDIAAQAEALADGETLNIPVSYQLLNLGLAESLANNDTCLAEVFNPATETVEDLCNDNTVNVLPEYVEQPGEAENGGLIVEQPITLTPQIQRPASTAFSTAIR